MRDRRPDATGQLDQSARPPGRRPRSRPARATRSASTSAARGRARRRPSVAPSPSGTSGAAGTPWWRPRRWRRRAARRRCPRRGRRARRTVPACGPATVTARSRQRRGAGVRRPRSCRPRCRCRRRRRVGRVGPLGPRAHQHELQVVERVAQRSSCSSVCAADSATRSRQVPGATVGGRIAGTSTPRSSSCVGHLERPLLGAQQDRAGSVTGARRARRSTLRPEALDAARRPRRSAAHRAPRALPRRRPGAPAVVKMNDRAVLRTGRSRRRSPATKPPTAPSVLDSVPTTTAPRRRRRAEHRVGLVDDQQRVVVGAQLGQLVERRQVAVHREHRVGDHQRGPSGRSASSAARWSTSAWRYTTTSARARRQPSMIDAWFSSSE